MSRHDHASMDEATVRAWTYVFDTRVIVSIVAGVVGIEMHTVSARLAPLLVLISIYLLFQSIRFRRVRRVEPYLPIADIAITGLFGLVTPKTWPALVAVGPAIVALGLVMFGWPVAAVTAVIGGVLFSIAALLAPDSGTIGLFGYFVGVALVLMSVAYAHQRERRSTKHFSDLVNGIDGIVWEWDVVTGSLTLISAQVETILGWTVAEALDPETWRIHAGDGGFSPDRAVQDALTSGITTVEFPIRHADGHVVWLRNRLTAAYDPSGRLEAVCGILVDTTELRSNRLAVKQLADVVESMQTATSIWHVTDPDQPENAVLMRRNSYFTPLLPQGSPDEVGRSLIEMFPVSIETGFAELIGKVVRSQERVTLADLQWVGATGTPHWYSVRIIPLPGNCIALLTDDVTERHETEEALRHQALHDTLTGLPNRALVNDRLSRSLAEARRSGKAVALLLMDLDQFKEVNDTLGHPVGDQLLIQVSARLAHALRDCDTVARLGGDEFAVLLTVDATHTGSQRVAERILAEIRRPYELEGVTIRTAASIGIALSPEHGHDAGTLIQRADIAMYNAKRLGGGWTFYSPEDDHTSVRRLSFANELIVALQRDELVLHYQPQVDLETGAVVGIESLVRWNHPDHGLLLPHEFIEVAEVSGVIQQITRWVIRTSISHAAQLSRAGHDVVVTANVSGRDLYDRTLAGGIATDLADFGISSDRLLLELTERELVDDPSQVMSALGSLADVGVRVAIDDFGTGWSSLANLTRLPVHQIKIDRSFVSRMMDDANDDVVVRSIIDLGHNLGLTVLGEGVENLPTMHALRDRGCDLAQGHLWGKPMTADRLVDWLAAHEPEATFRA
jgi:diguanylate cyclase (GGDEF)-like protein/PAS domain S-box-containing protein